MKSLLLIIFFLFCSVTLWGDAVIVIKGVNRRPSIKLAEHSGASCRVKRHSGAIEVSCRPKRQFQNTKLTFKVLSDDDFAFTVGGGYIRKEGNKKDEFDWIEYSLFKVNGLEMIGSGSGKGGNKSECVARPKAVKGSVKVKKGDTFLVTGPTTGAVEGIISSLYENDRSTESAAKGSEITFPCGTVLRKNDAFYILQDLTQDQ